MTLYLNELAPWETKNQYYKVVQLGKDVGQQASLISRQTKDLIASQLRSTTSIVASQARIREGLDVVARELTTVSQGMQGLQATFEWGIAEVVWQLEQNRETLRSILDVLSAPLDTQAKELKKRADRAYTKGLLDDALEEYLASEKKNRFDFTTHISIGIIYAFHKHDKVRALEYFDKAAKYSRGESDYYTAYALLHKALIKVDLGLFQEAEVASSEAVALMPSLAEAHFQNAQDNARLGNLPKSIAALRAAIGLDRYYCLKAASEPAFDPIRADVNDLFVELASKEEAFCRERLSAIEPCVTMLNEIAQAWPRLRLHLVADISRIKTLIQRSSYFDLLDAREKLADLTKQLLSFATALRSSISSAICSAETEVSRLRRDAVQGTEKRNRRLRSWLGIVGCILSTGYGCRACVQYSEKLSQGHTGDFMDIVAFLFFPLLLWIGIAVAGTAISTGIGYLIGESLVAQSPSSSDMGRLTREAETLRAGLRQLDATRLPDTAC